MPPSVSIVLRAHGRDLAPALRALAAQQRMPLEVLLVGGTPHARQHAVALALHTGLPLRCLDGTRANAAATNLALMQVRGDAFCVLDDGSHCTPQHLAMLCESAQAHPEALAWYARCRVTEAIPGAAPVFGRAFNRALFHYDKLFELAATLIDRRALALGCRFDGALDDGDQDFLQQVAQHGWLHFAAAASPLVDVQRRAPAPHVGRRVVAAQRQLAKWAGERLHHTLRSSLLCHRAGERLAAGDVAAARSQFEFTLDQYPGDPQALHGLARCELAQQRPVVAMRHVLAALELDPDNGEYLATAASLRGLLGGSATAGNTLAGWALPAWSMAPLALSPSTAPTQPVAMPHESCPCGSAARYVHCCGMPKTTLAPRECSLRQAVQNARERHRRGEGDHAAAILGAIQPEALHDAALACEAGELCFELHLLDAALALLQRALELEPTSSRALDACTRCAELHWRPLAWRSSGTAIRASLDRLEQRCLGHQSTSNDTLHIVSLLDALGGTERRALNLYRQLSALRATTLWSTAAPLAQHAAAAPIRVIGREGFPDGGTLLLIGTWFPCGDWLEQAPFERVVICHNLSEQYAGLLERLLQLELNPSCPRVELVFPSRTFRDLTALPGAVEYSAVDLEAFHRQRAPEEAMAPLTIGRHGRAHRLKFHPNDPALFRAVMARGHRVRLLGGSAIAGAFAGDTSLPELLPAGAQSARDFLDTLDVFVYRKHPAFVETGGTVILEAMAMELPVIVFAEHCGMAEVIEHDVNGLLVHDEVEALAALDRLTADPLLRRRLGQAARRTVVALMHQQEVELLARYASAPPRITALNA